MATLNTTVIREGTTTRYAVAMPLTALDVDGAKLQAGIGFNLVVHDDDGSGREGWMQLAPGIADSKDPLPFPTLRVE